MKVFGFLIALSLASTSEACTTMAISKGASATGIPMVAHSADCIQCDTRLALVPGRKHSKGSLHDVVGTHPDFPRRHSNRATIYMDMPDRFPVLAHIPEAPYTYGVWEVTYGLINEVGLTMGESSTSSKIPASGIDMPDPANGNKKAPAMLCIRELIQLGLERCDTAECAIDLMGDMAVKYGFYGESVMGGEALTLADTTGDAWIFHVMQDWSTNSSAIWAAQRVPQGHIAVIGNEFSIKEIPQEPHPDYKHSANMFSEAKKAGYWDGKSTFSFVGAYGHAGLPTYASVRLWNVYNIVAPSLNLEFKESPYDLPFSVPVDEKLTKEDVMNLFRTHYEGTEFDMSKGILAGPYGNINRIEGGNYRSKGSYARGISIPRTAYTHVGYPDPQNPATFLGVDSPASSVFVPLLSKTLQEARSIDIMDTANLYAPSYQVGRKDIFDLDSAWWTFDLVANWMNLNYRNMSLEYVRPKINELQEVMHDAYTSGDTDAVTKAQNHAVSEWRKLLHLLIVRYNDGGFNFSPYLKGIDGKDFVAFGYPDEYLDDIGFNNSFFRAITTQDVIQNVVDKKCGAHFADRVMEELFGEFRLSSAFSYIQSVVPVIIGMVLGYVIARRQNRQEDENANPLLKNFI